MTKIDLFQAVRRNDSDTFYSQIDKVDINLIDEDGQNLLHEAVSFNNTLLGKELITRKINVNHKDGNSQTPLHYIANKKETELALLILNGGGDLNIEDKYGNQPLWTAVFNARGDYKIVKQFMNFSPDINHKNRNDKSPLDFAQQISDQSLISILKR
jgi:ankyrin repeat protein